MEWVETTGRTVEEALDAALDELGVDETDVEFEVVDEPKVGLFGRVRGEARVRARVRPNRPRPKEDRRERRRRPARPDDGSSSSADAIEAPVVQVSNAREPAATNASQDEATEAAPERPSRRPPRRPKEEDEMDGDVDVPMETQGEVAVTFLEGLLERFGVEAAVSSRLLDDESFEVAVHGQDLGLFIGPKGAAMNALQDLTRTVVQRKTSARRGRLLLDVAGYRERRKEALERFARAAAERVLESGARVVLEPMNAADRKIVHDTVNDIVGVATTSEGEDPRRRVVLMPE